jgi:hypothetical protein
MIKKTLIVLFALLAIPFLVETRTEGFISSNLYFSLPVKIDHHVSEKYNCSEKEHEEIVNQTYRYLGKGTQFYVFESLDNKYVIKFLRPHQLKPKFWVHLLHFPKFLDLYRKQEILHRKQKCEKTLKACSVAFERMRERLGLKGMYLKDGSDKQLKIKSKLGHWFTIDLGSTCYIIQKKADAFLDTALLQARDNSTQEVEKILDLFIEGISFRFKHQISNTDPNVFSNFALLDDRVVEVDFGDFFDNGELLPPPFFAHEINRYAKSFTKWATINAPDVLNYFDKRLEEELQKYEKYYEEKTL